jgi:hypothetical protein
MTRPTIIIGLAALVMSQAVIVASAEPRPGYPPRGSDMPSSKPSYQEVRQQRLLSSIKVGDVPTFKHPLMSSAALKVPCPVCTFKAPMLTIRK